jgi:hypothetical protein
MNIVKAFGSDSHFGLVNMAEHDTEKAGRNGSTVDLLWGGSSTDLDVDWHNSDCSFHDFLIPSN